MCGFVGFTDPEAGSPSSRAVADRMLSAVVHRGPDGAHWCHHRGVTLAHCGLAFVDPPGGRQPFLSSGGVTAVVFNGELYNHAELRGELLARGAVLRTGSDTEVLVELFEREGVRMLRRIRGMYAFAAHDSRTDTTVLARDPVGKKPLYYTRTRHGVAFASELTALLRHPDSPGEPDVPTVADYLVLGAFPAPRSAVRDVYKVRPGCYVRFRQGVGQEAEHWRPVLRPGRPVPLREAEERFEALFTAAVSRRVTSTEQELGVLLSGGIDSSAVAAAAQRLAPAAVPTFSAGFADRSYDESAHAEAVARYLGTEHHTVRIADRDLADLVADEYPTADEPLADPSLLPTRLVCRAAGRRVRGVLTGDGADELLLGYRFFQAERIMEALHATVHGPGVRLLVRCLNQLPERPGNLPAGTALRRLARGMRAAPEHRFYLSTAPFAPGELPTVLSAEARRQLTGHDPFREIGSLLARQAAELTDLERCQVAIVCHFLRDTILTKTDRGGMRSAVELRSPFLDLDLLEYCNALPRRLKLRRLTGKYLLRRVAARWLPPQTVRRTKLGFRAPVGELLRGPLRPLLRETLTPRDLAAGGILDPVAVRTLVDDHLAGTRDHARRIWALLCFQLWYAELRTGPARGASGAQPILPEESRHAR